MKRTIHFLPDNVKMEVEEGDNLLSAAAEAGVYIHAFCGGDGVCGKCKVKIEQGTVITDLASKLKKKEHDQGLRLACKSTIDSDIVVRIPESVTADGKALKRKPKTTRSISARTVFGFFQVIFRASPDNRQPVFDIDAQCLLQR